jgi:hypothetical protein
MEHCDKAGSQPESQVRTTRNSRLLVGGIALLGLIIVVFWVTGRGRQLAQQVKYAGRAPTFSGSSQKLTRTVNELRDNVLKAPLRVIGAEEVAARLNAAKQSASDLDPESFYAAGGSIQDGIIEKIKKDMAAKFPSHAPQSFGSYDAGILAYSYLIANVPFTHPFRQAENGLVFGDSQGGKTQVEAFGIWGAFLRSEYESVQDQVVILYCDETRRRNPRSPMKEFAIDLCKYSQPYQVVLAVTEPNDSLARILLRLRTQIQEFKNRDNYESRSRLQKLDVVRSPEMSWEIDYHFRELLGKMIGNVNLPIVEAMQTIKFRLDRSGAAVESEARVTAAAIPRVFEFNRPFLVYMQKRGAEQPFFVMWVDNAELLVRK